MVFWDNVRKQCRITRIADGRDDAESGGETDDDPNIQQIRNGKGEQAEAERERREAQNQRQLSPLDAVRERAADGREEIAEHEGESSDADLRGRVADVEDDPCVGDEQRPQADR